MKLCEFCVHQRAEDQCAAARPIPKKMRCPDFTPGIERFCATPADYTGREQLKQMAVFFGLAGKELQRVLSLSETPGPAHQAQQSSEALPLSPETGPVRGALKADR
jgi:hypothetical protein